MSEGSFPRAYKDGFKEFYGREFLVSPDVLIPRPETEVVIEMVLSLAGKEYLPGVMVPERVLPKEPKILDVGTGSGCIAVTLKCELPAAEISACDISKPALNVARENARKLGANVEFVQSDLLEAIRGDFDLMVANLPYVDKDWSWISGVEYEPSVALYAEDNGLRIINRFLEQAARRTKYIILEADPVQHADIIKKAESLGFKHLETRGYQLLFTILGQRKLSGGLLATAKDRNGDGFTNRVFAKKGAKRS